MRISFKLKWLCLRYVIQIIGHCCHNGFTFHNKIHIPSLTSIKLFRFIFKCLGLFSIKMYASQSRHCAQNTKMSHLIHEEKIFTFKLSTQKKLSSKYHYFPQTSSISTLRAQYILFYVET